MREQAVPQMGLLWVQFTSIMYLISPLFCVEVVFFFSLFLWILSRPAWKRHTAAGAGGEAWAVAAAWPPPVFLALICNCIQWRRNRLCYASSRGAPGPDRDGVIERERQTQIKMTKTEKANGLTLVRGHFLKVLPSDCLKAPFFPPSVQDTPEMWSVRL